MSFYVNDKLSNATSPDAFYPLQNVSQDWIKQQNFESYTN